jgi:peptide deformylase
VTLKLAKVVQYPDERLRQVSRPLPVDEADTMLKLRELVFTMRETLHDARGYGLSAIQLGVPVRLMIVHTPEIKAPLIMVNPHIVGTSVETVEMMEGCLSFDGRRDPIIRPKRVTVRWWNEYGHYHEPQEYGGWTARAIQHEHDHLDGFLLIDKLLPAARRMLDRQFKRKVAKKATKLGIAHLEQA